MKKETVVLGGGCFWCTEAVFGMIRGVTAALVGYSGGKTKNPTYEQVCLGTSGHAEVLKIDYDADEIKLQELLEIFFAMHDPTTLNRQGNDSGDQYRSVIFYFDDLQKKQAEKVIKEKQPEFRDKIVTKIEKLGEFYPAEEYHRNYFEKNPDQSYCRFVISPKVNKIMQKYKNALKK